MIKKIAADQLVSGMYLAGLIVNEPIRESISKGLIRDQSVIDELKSSDGLHLLIDTQKGLDVVGGSKSGSLATVQGIIPSHPVDFAEEIRYAQKAHQKALNVIENVFSGVKKGESINAGAVEKTVGALVDSVFRNQSALLCLGLIRQKDNYLMEHSVNLCVLLGGGQIHGV